MNYDFVWEDRLAVGTTPADPADMQSLLDAGFTDLIDCRSELDIQYLVTGTPFQGHYLWDGTDDLTVGEVIVHSHKPIEWFAVGLKFGIPILKSGKGKLLIFCAMGANRSATMAITHLFAMGLSEIEAFIAIDTHRIIDIPGLFECGWFVDGYRACKTLGYIT